MNETSKTTAVAFPTSPSRFRFYLLRSALVAILAVAGCNKSPPPPGGSGKLFGVSFQTMNNPFFVDVNEGLKTVIEANGDRLVTLDAQFNSLKQKNDISDLLQQQPAAIFINPVNWEGVKGSLIEAKRKDVPGDHRRRARERRRAGALPGGLRQRRGRPAGVPRRWPRSTRRPRS